MQLGKSVNLNLVIISGRLTVPPETESPDRQGKSRLLLTVPSGEPRTRVDLLPIVAASRLFPDGLSAGDSLYVVGSLQRRFSAAGGRSRIEVVAHCIERPAAG